MIEQLITLREELRAVLAKVESDIANKQIVKETDMNLYGFEKISEDINLVTYKKVYLDRGVYEVILDLLNPTLITIHRLTNKHHYTFEVNSLEDFRELLIFGNL